MCGFILSIRLNLIRRCEIFFSRVIKMFSGGMQEDGRRSKCVIVTHSGFLLCMEI